MTPDQMIARFNDAGARVDSIQWLNNEAQDVLVVVVFSTPTIPYAVDQTVRKMGGVLSNYSGGSGRAIYRIPGLTAPTPVEG